MDLSEQDQQWYLANILYLARLDGAMSSKELSAVEEIRSLLGAKKGTLKAAMKSVEVAGHVPSAVGEFRTRVANLTDMLYVVMLDGDMSEAEAAAVREFSLAAGVTSDQLGMMLRETSHRVELASSTSSCAKCSTPIPVVAKFCPNCGNAIQSSSHDSVALSLEIPKTGYAIEFCESSAAGFAAAMDHARTAQSFSSCVRTGKSWYMAAWREESFLEAVRLAQLLSGIRNRKCYYNGSELAWDELFGFAWCAGSRNQAYKPEEYCFGKDENRVNPWGCKQTQLEWTEWAEWFSYGKFRRVGILGKNYVWQFDKARIRHAIVTNLHKFRHCPYLRMSLVEAFLRIMPDEVEVSTNGSWKFNQRHEEVPGSIRVTEVNRSGDFEFTNEYFSNGVRPVGFEALRDLLRRSFAEANVVGVSAEDLAK